jgi:RNA polymerase sigma factor (sigma-70 family)
MAGMHDAQLESYYKKYHKAVFHTAFMILKHPAAAEDAMQEVFVKFISGFEKEIDNVGAWLITVTKNYCYNYIRDNKRTIQVDNVEAKSSSPAKIAEQNIFFEEVLSNLEGDEREIFTLHVASGLKHREIASILSMPQSTVRWKYSNAVRKLRNVLKKY